MAKARTVRLYTKDGWIFVNYIGEIDQDSLEFKQLADGNCPDCGHRGFVFGPRGGASINVKCGNRECESQFNLTTFGWDLLVMAQRIQVMA